MSEEPTHSQPAIAPIAEPAAIPVPEVPPTAFINPIGMRASESPPARPST